jgi:hypothetical protein
LIITNLVTPQAGAEQELLFNKPTADSLSGFLTLELIFLLFFNDFLKLSEINVNMSRNLSNVFFPFNQHVYMYIFQNDATFEMRTVLSGIRLFDDTI